MRRLFIIRKDLNMSAGKLAAQVGHCAEAYWTRMFSKYALKHYKYEDKEWHEPPHDDDADIIGYEPNFLLDKDIFEQYINGRFVKTICEARNKNNLLKAKALADELGLVETEDYGLIYDACFTELTPEEPDGTTLTGIWFKPLPDEIAHKISKKYQLYK
jgi:peptidyl-tRNA hydrolase